MDEHEARALLKLRTNSHIQFVAARVLSDTEGSELVSDEMKARIRLLVAVAVVYLAEREVSE